MIETKNDMQLADERLLADEWQTAATPEPEIIAHLFARGVSDNENMPLILSTECMAARGE